MQTKAHLLNETMRLLVAAAAPLPLGVKAWQIKEYVTRTEDAVSPAEFMGLEPGQVGYCLLDEYVNLTGYQFDWGVLTENVDQEAYKEEDGEHNPLIFEIVPEKVLIEYPYPERLDTVFFTMYEEHPLFNEALEYELGEGIDSVLSFMAFGESEGTLLRTWMSSVFLPRILPDILATMGALLEIRKTDADEFENQCEKWAGGDYDHRHLVMVSTLQEAADVH